MINKPNLDVLEICKKASLDSVNLTPEELGEDGFNSDEIWLVSFSILTQNDPSDLFDFLQFVDSLAPDLIPYDYR